MPRPISGCSAARPAVACSPMKRSPRIRLANGDPAARIAIARFFAENIAVQAPGLERTVTEADSVNAAARRWLARA